MHGINPIVLQNRLLSQAGSGARAYSTAIGSVLNNSTGNNKKSSLPGTDTSEKSTRDIQASKKTYTEMKTASENMKSRIKDLQEILGKNQEELGEEEAAEYRNQAETEIAGLIEDYNALIETLSEEKSTVNNVFLKQLKDYIKSAGSELSKLGITQNSDGTLALDKESLGRAELSDLQKVFGAESALLAKLSERADNIKENAETNISLLNSELYGGTYSYDKYGSDIYDVLFGNQYNAKG